MNTQKPLPRKKLSDRYFNELKSGGTVPRNEKTGEPIPFKVGGNYTIVNETTKEELKARCTQDCPYHLVLLETTQGKPMFETGATSEAVNNLILFTDTTRELAELRDKIYNRALTPGDIVYAKFKVLGALAGNASLKNAFSELLRTAIRKYKSEFKQDADSEITSIRHYDDKGNEFTKIYVSGFTNWKSEHGYK